MQFEQIKAIIFDFDDTLIYSFESVCTAIEKTAETLSLPLPSPETISELRGVPLLKIMTTLWPFIAAKQAADTYLKVYSHDQLKKIEGVNETLTILKSAGYDLHILSSKKSSSLLPHLEFVQLHKKIFSSIIGVEMVKYHKPDGRVFQDFLKQYNPSELVYVGDSLNDFFAAKNAGISFIGVLTGGEKEQDFRKHGATIIIPHVGMLPSLFPVSFT